MTTQNYKKSWPARLRLVLNHSNENQDMSPSSLPAIYLKAGREKPVSRKHPWIFSGGIQRMDACEPGQLVDIKSANGNFLARGYANPKSKITARLLSFDVSENIDAAFWRRRIQAAVNNRKALKSTRHPDDNASRIIMSEADRLPGLIVDQYDEYLVVQALTAGIDRHLGVIVQALDDIIKPKGIFERSDDQVRELEGLPLVNRLLHGKIPDDGSVLVRENGLAQLVDLNGGHKTGFYLDQRQNHALARKLATSLLTERPQLRVLDTFCYTGGFTLNTLAAGASHVMSLDASAPALERLAVNLEKNNLPASRNERRVGDAFKVLRELREAKTSFDMIILDPPKFAHNGGQIEKAARGYKDLNLLAFQLLRPGGILMTFSCSGLISTDLFQKIVFGAMHDAKTDAQVLQFLTQADDHPVLLSFPESLYLKGLACRKLDTSVTNLAE